MTATPAESHLKTEIRAVCMSIVTQKGGISKIVEFRYIHVHAKFSVKAFHRI